ncbi:lipase [Phycomyces blakesleeanus]|uniref:Lipase n=1 Tax=Phycomyces blakesleeanus TaxID=4837 RepID=A0ABR3AT77_PHYBL
MKITKLSVLSISIVLAFSQLAAAAPVKDNHVSLVPRDYVLPPVIDSRTTVSGSVPVVDLTTEDTARSNNGPLPKDVELTNGIGVNATSGPSQVQALVAVSKSVSVASAAQVQDLKLFTQLSANAYCRIVVPLNQWTCDHCSADETLVSTFFTVLIDTNGFITRNDKTKTINLVFRGTNSFQNFFTDITLITQSYPPVKNARIHVGFYTAYLDVQKSVISTMIEQISKYPSYNVAVSGHSLGGALAVIATMDLYQRDTRFNSNNLFLRTYGQPRIGNPDLGYYLAGTGIEYKRTVNDRDMVPHLPPLSSDYMHVGTEHWKRDDGSVKICTNFESSGCSNSIVPFTTIVDHLS